MPYPRHEAELERKAVRECLHSLRHPSKIPSFMKTLWHDTGEYYAGHDTVDLEREELIELVAWTRRVALKLTGSAILLGLMVGAAIGMHL